MLTSASGTGWELYVEGNVVVAVFTDKAAWDEAEKLNKTFLEMVDLPQVDAHVSCVDMDESAGNKMLNAAEDAAAGAIDKGLKRWGIADEGLGKLAIKNHVDIDELEVEAFDSQEEAVKWAKK